MNLEALRSDVLAANLRLVRDGLVVETFGNASGIDREQNLVAIKPSGIDYARLKASDLVIALYKAFPNIGGVAHTHSRHATAWAQARRIAREARA